MEYLYADGEFYHFMMTDGSFEQHAVDAKAVGDASKWLDKRHTSLRLTGTARVTRLITSNRSCRDDPAQKVIQRKVAQACNTLDRRCFQDKAHRNRGVAC